MKIPVKIPVFTPDSYVIDKTNAKKLIEGLDTPLVDLHIGSLCSSSTSRASKESALETIDKAELVMITVGTKYALTAFVGEGGIGGIRYTYDIGEISEDDVVVEGYENAELAGGEK